MYTIGEKKVRKDPKKALKATASGLCHQMLRNCLPHNKQRLTNAFLLTEALAFDRILSKNQTYVLKLVVSVLVEVNLVESS